MAAASYDLTIEPQEIFGPLLANLNFASEQDALRLANDHSKASRQAFETRDISRASRCAKQVDAGAGWTENQDIANSSLPCHGFEQSGFDKEKGSEQLQQISRTQVNWITVQ